MKSPKRNLPHHQVIGMLGEDIACKYLKNKGFSIVGRNYWKKWGEIDVIAKKEGLLHFIEVKTVSRENLDSVLHETDGYRPEENVHPKKLQRLGKTIQTYLLEREINNDWQFDVVAVFIDTKHKKARIRFMGNIVI